MAESVRAHEIYTDEVDIQGGFKAKIRDRQARSAADSAQNAAAKAQATANTALALAKTKAVIDDDAQSDKAGWSSEKIRGEISSLIQDGDTTDSSTWSSEKIEEGLFALETRISTKQPTITSTGLLKGGGDGEVVTAALGDDYGALSFSVVLAQAAWADGRQRVSDERFLAEGYTYVVAPSPVSLEHYADCVIRAGDVAEDGAMDFTCGYTPKIDLLVHVMRAVSGG